MTLTRPWRYLAAGLLLVLALGLPACGAEEEATGEGGVKTDVGVTSEPCPGSANKDRGCIYLGTLSDLTEGPFAPLAVPITDAQKAFWERVNDSGGIGGKYDVDVAKYTRDNKYNPEEHVAKLREIEPNVLALAQSLGTPPTLAGLEIQKQGEIVAAPASWWSGWSFDDESLILESGQSYCTESMNGLDWAAEEFGKPAKVLAVGYPGDYGGDSAAGVKVWAEANGASAETVETAPNATAGNQDAVVGAIAEAGPDVVVLATGPAEMAEIVGKAVAGGFKGQFVGSVPTWNPAVLKSEAAPAVEAKLPLRLPVGPVRIGHARSQGDGGGDRRQAAGERRLHVRLDLVVPAQGRAREGARGRRPDPGRRARRPSTRSPSTTRARCRRRSTAAIRARRWCARRSSPSRTRRRRWGPRC